jgi:tRNA modification GTPase
LSSAIAAVATAPGRGGVGVVRVSSPTPDVLDVITSELLSRSLDSFEARKAVYLNFSDLDQGLAIYFPAPYSYTGEHVLELQGHGGPIVLKLLLQAVLMCGSALLPIRLAEPGEFTKRAYLNDKIDLAQAEAVADLIDASTEQAARSAARSLSGEFSAAIYSLVEHLINLRMLVEATLDFPDEEIDFLQAADAQGKLATICEQAALVLAKATQGALLREGMQVVLMGEPNVGKSSLLNALAGADVAIVTPIAGTTRDKVVQMIQIEGVPINVIDTAGLRQTNDEVEKIGIDRTRQAITQADAVIWLQDARHSASEKFDQDFENEFDHSFGLSIDVPRLIVFNKIDLIDHHAFARLPTGDNFLNLSVRQGFGLDALRQKLLTLAGWQQGQGVYLARERHLVAMRLANEYLSQAKQRLLLAGEKSLGSFATLGVGLELVAEELRLAQDQLSSITGEFSADDLLGEIFTRFCIGK